MMFSVKTICLLLFMLWSSRSETICVEKGTCSPCSKEDSTKDYCKETGKMRKVICNDGININEEWRSCPMSTEDEQIRVILFQVSMGVVGAIGFWATQRRKLSTLSLFDTRKLRCVELHDSFAWNLLMIIGYYIDICHSRN